MYMRRRILIAILGLSLASLSPVPLSACAMLMSLPADCAPAPAEPMPASHCEHAVSPEAQMEQNQAKLQANASELPCCQVTAAPVPDTGAGMGKTEVAPTPAVLEDALQATSVRVFERTATQAERDFSSPPDRQPLLCTFLI